jgi:hypothetical protein|tara:strand:+ start:92 stop:409 length:318 start_codon:yes stop_codon:yes gene_type:complete
MFNLVLTTILSFQVNLIYIGQPEWADGQWIQVEATSYSERYDIYFCKTDFNWTEFSIRSINYNGINRNGAADDLVVISINYEDGLWWSQITNPHTLLLDTVLGKL